MGYLIFNGSELYRIASNDSDLSLFNLSTDFITKQVSDSDFNNVRFSLSTATLNGETISYESLLGTDTNNNPNTSWEISNSDVLQEYLNTVSAALQNSINSNQNAPSEYQTYKNYLDNFDVNSVTYPLMETWEQHCNNNSVNFFHPLQII